MRIGRPSSRQPVRAGKSATPAPGMSSRRRFSMPGIKREDGMEMTVKATSVQRTGNILVVDDEPTIVDLLIEILTDAGYIAYAAPPGAPALAAIARYLPALLLLDIRRPDKDGAALIARMREVASATMPIVMMTTAPRDIDPLIVSESVDLLAKPFDLDDLLACVARHVQPTQAADQRLALCTA